MVRQSKKYGFAAWWAYIAGYSIRHYADVVTPQSTLEKQTDLSTKAMKFQDVHLKDKKKDCKDC